MVEGLAAHHGDCAALNVNDLFELTLGPRPWVTCLVATLSDELVGYAALQSKVQLHFARKIMSLEHLFVLPQLRGQGIGTALIEGACNEARLAGCCRLTVGVARDNPRAAALYRSVGFEDQAITGPRFAMAL